MDVIHIKCARDAFLKKKKHTLPYLFLTKTSNLTFPGPFGPFWALLGPCSRVARGFVVDCMHEYRKKHPNASRRGLPDQLSLYSDGGWGQFPDPGQGLDQEPA